MFIFMLEIEKYELIIEKNELIIEQWICLACHYPVDDSVLRKTVLWQLNIMTKLFRGHISLLALMRFYCFFTVNLLFLPAHKKSFIFFLILM